MGLPKDPQKLQEYKDKQSRITKARGTPEYREKLSVAHKGYTVSNETKVKISQTLQGHIPSEQTRLKIRQSNKARWALKDPQELLEYKSKMSKIAKEKGFGKWNKGKTRSEEHKLKMSKTAKVY